MKTGTVVLASGGLDSFIAWWVHKDTAANIFVNIGHKYATKEINALCLLAAAIPEFNFRIVSGGYLGSMELPSGIIPNRNAHLLLHAAQFGNDIIMGVLHGEINSDKSLEFFEAMEQVLNISNRGQYWNNDVGTRYTISSPLRMLTKSEAVAMYLACGGKPEHLLLTVSCYDAADGPCGACPSCFKRWVAFKNNGITEPMRTDPVQWAHAHGVISKCFEGVYDKRRANEIMKAVQNGA